MKYRILFLLTLVMSLWSCGQSEFKLTTETTAQANVIASMELTEKLKTTPFKLIAQTSEGKSEIPFQIDGSMIYWKTPAENAEYSIVLETASIMEPIQMMENEGQLEIYQNNTKVVGYQMAVQDVPEGVDPAYKRSGYLHPVNTPKGKRLTQIQPEDHYHHYGIWNPWTHTVFEGDTLDFWNLRSKQGTVRFAKLLEKNTGPVFGEFEVLHEHVVLKGEEEKIALNENQQIKVIPIDDHQYLLDIKITYQCATDEAFNIIEYRYGGFGWRTTEEWDNQNSRVLSSEGNTRKNADGSTARWCIVEGKLDEGRGGALMLSHPENYNHPEPLRVWPEDQYGRGDLFVNFATTKNTDWTFHPGEEYVLQYRLLVFDGTIDESSAEEAWKQFAKPLVYTLK